MDKLCFFILILIH